MQTRAGRRWTTRAALAAAALLPVAVVAGCGGSSPSGAPTTGPTTTNSAPATGTPTAPSIAPTATATAALHWGACTRHTYKHTYQCATLDVPLDHAHPTGKQIQIALIRTVATDPAQRIGSLLVDPGGPGASTVADWDFLSGQVDATLHKRFDVVGFDPRGVGDSTAVRCTSGAGLDAYTSLDYAPDTAAQTAALERGAKTFADACAQNAGALLPWVGTKDAAKDMDDIRAALGDAKLSYLGFSYGTALGATYADEFPTHVRALVLDGAFSPSGSVVAETDAQSAAFQRQVDRFLAYCSGVGGCGLGTGNLHTGLADLEAKVAANPLPTGDGGRKLAAGQLFFAIGEALYDQQSWPVLRQGLQQAATGDGSTLLEISDDYTERSPDGTYANLTEANLAINCRDYDWPRPTSAFLAAAKASESASPDFGEANFDLTLACTYWPGDAIATAPVAALHAAGAAPILVVATTGDPATPYAQGVALAHELDSGVLLTNVGEQHTAYGYSACVRKVADAYLISGQKPTGSLRCDDENES